MASTSCTTQGVLRVGQVRKAKAKPLEVVGKRADLRKRKEKEPFSSSDSGIWSILV